MKYLCLTCEYQQDSDSGFERCRFCGNRTLTLNDLPEPKPERGDLAPNDRRSPERPTYPRSARRA